MQYYINNYAPKTCVNYIAAVEGRKRDTLRGIGDRFVESYIRRGCLDDCPGFRESCGDMYVSLERILDSKGLDRRDGRRGRMFRKNIKEEIFRGNG